MFVRVRVINDGLYSSAVENSRVDGIPRHRTIASWRGVDIREEIRVRRERLVYETETLELVERGLTKVGRRLIQHPLRTRGQRLRKLRASVARMTQAIDRLEQVQPLVEGTHLKLSSEAQGLLERQREWEAGAVERDEKIRAIMRGDPVADMATQVRSRFSSDEIERLVRLLRELPPEQPAP